MLLDRNELRSYELKADDGEHTAPLPVLGTDGDAQFLVGRHGIDLAQLFPEFAPNKTYLVDSIGHWSLHELLAFCLNRIGPANVWLTSWGITAEPLKEVMRLLDAGIILDLDCLFDSRVKLQCPQAYQLLLHKQADRRVRVHLGKNHSKTIVMINEHHAITVVSSANLTINPRIESYVVLTHRHVALEKKRVIELVMDGGQPFESE